MLAAFLCAHLVYIVLFVRRRQSAAAPSAQFAFPALLLVYGLAFRAYLAPSLGALRVPVFCYIAAIVAMVAAASRANYRSPWVLSGAVLFLISDFAPRRRPFQDTNPPRRPAAVDYLLRRPVRHHAGRFVRKLSAPPTTAAGAQPTPRTGEGESRPSTTFYPGVL